MSIAAEWPDDDQDDDWDDGPPPQEEPDFDAIAMEEHFTEFHPDGGPCNCPVPTPEEIAAEWAERDRQHREEAHAGGPCDCPPEEPPF